MLVKMTVYIYSFLMIVRLLRLRDRGWPIPKYQFAFKQGIEGELTVYEERDAVLNRHTRIARLRDLHNHQPIGPALLDAQLVGLTREVLSLSGIERIEDPTLLKVEDFAQTWICFVQ